ncbi:MAG: glycosyltransferase [Actinobacteria bacterium]|nr:glycosyltransferase [Cyanobacteriota bacterium]MCL5771854.1 glycosyltransferase [Actinomycetota bacterium]
MDTKYLLKFGKIGKKLFYFFEILKFIRSKIIKKFRKLFGINEISQKKITKFIEKNKLKDKLIIGSLNPDKISIIISCYNHAQYLKKMFESVISQTVYPDEIILIDDFSSDNTREILKEILSNNKEKLNLKVVYNNKNIGQCASLNKAISITNSDLIMILNDDDYLFYDAVEILKKLFKLNKEIALIGSTSVHFDSDEFLDNNKKYILDFITFEELKLTIHTPEDLLNYKNYNDLNMTHSGCTFYKEVWDFVGGYFPNKKDRLVPFSDRDFQLRVNIFFNIGVLYNTPLSFWRNNSSVDYGKNS